MFPLGRVLALILFFSAVSFAADAPRPASNGSHLLIRSGTLTTTSGAPVQLANVQAELPPKERRGDPTFIRSGAAFLTSESLTQLINSKLSNAKIKDLKIETKDGQKAKISGKIDKAGIPVPVSIEGPVSLTSDGKLRLDIKTEKAGIVPIKAITEMLHIDTTSSAEGKPNSAVDIQKDAVVVDPAALLGTTAQGRVTSVTTSRKGLTLGFGERRAKRQRK